ncbi:class I SAM-dependent methyltransferase [Sphingomonas sp.]|uniref:class I SAM-dependent methyltransferase n=1 Tax=Sphingomonas sp. TaxID=28214 RepID=UPI003B3BDDA4
MSEFDNPDHWTSAAARYERNAHPYTARYAEAALSHVPLTPAWRVLDVAAGTGALALAAARTGADVLATDFSPGMVALITEKRVPNVQARVMDGQALDLPDASFDAVFSMFGVFLFPDWRAGLAEMARVTRPGGYGVVAAWEGRGAGPFLLLGNLIQALFPERELAPMPDSMTLLGTERGLAGALRDAGYHDPQIERVTRDFDLEMSLLDDADGLFGASPDWTGLTDAQRRTIIAEIGRRADGRPRLPVASTAMIGVARR